MGRRNQMIEGKKNIIAGLIEEYDIKSAKDILVLCADGLSGIKEAIAYPKTEYKRCIVHQVRNTSKNVADKDKKEFPKDLKKIYHAQKEEIGFEIMLEITEKWDEKHRNAMKIWSENLDCISILFKFSQ
jgi:transposase-like protein